MANLTFIEKVLIIIAVTLVLLLYNAIRNFFKYRGEYFKQKSEKEKIEIDSIIDGTSPDSETFTDILNNSVEILNFCKSLIEIEIQNILQEVSRLDQKYEMRNLDTDAKTVAENVYKSLNHEILLSKKFILTNDYILGYITSQSLAFLIKYTEEYNNARLMK